MMKVYLAIPRAADKLLGHVSDDGKVYATRLGPDDRVGRVDLDSGRVYQDRLGADKKIGHVDLESGKVYTTRLGPDDYVGKVHGDGRIYRHVSLLNDDYVARVDPFVSYAHAAGALLLLVWPELEPDEQAIGTGKPSAAEADVSDQPPPEEPLAA